MKTISRKEEIILVASRLFYEKGYKTVSMRDIATAMNIKAASLYNHIHGKQEILSEIILKVAKEFTVGMEKVVSENSSAIEKVEKVIEMHVDITVNYSEALAALNNDWMHLEPSDLSAFVKMREDYEENFRKIIMLAEFCGVRRNQQLLQFLFHFQFRSREINQPDFFGISAVDAFSAQHQGPGGKLPDPFDYIR